MVAKQTYSVRLEDRQRRELESRANTIGLPVGHLIRSAIEDFLRQQVEKDYLSEVEARIATAVNRLGRQVEKDRAEQQLVVGLLDYLREWLAFALPAVTDKVVAKEIQRERTTAFYRDLHLVMKSEGKAKITAYMATKIAVESRWCVVCGTGQLTRREENKNVFWDCTNHQASPSCMAQYIDIDGEPQLG